ncbi:MAG: serine/threonine-protein kinase [Gemmatimonadaceae bacterium]
MADENRQSPEGYEIRRELGRGAAAVVYLAHDQKHDRLVALKHLQSDLLLMPTRFLSEIHTLAGMQHSHILPLHDSGMWNDSPFYVMPFVDGMTLEQRIARDGALPLPTALRIAREVGEALEYAHRHGVIHRDIKPANILLDDTNAYVADFGIAHVISLASSMRVTGTGFAVGTPAYMSPEQAAGESNLDCRSDLYSLGCVLFEMLAGEPLFKGSTPRELMTRRHGNAAPSVRGLLRHVPKSVESVMARALSHDPDDRYATAAEFVGEIHAAERELEARPSRASRWPSAAFAVVLLLVVAGAAMFGHGAMRESELTVDQSTYAVLPFRHSGAGTNAWLDGDGCARLLHDAMARWQGIRLVDDMRVSDVWSRQSSRTVAAALATARQLRAGQLAWGEVVSVGDSLEIRAVAYDVGRGQTETRQFVVRIARDGVQIGRAFAALADSIVIGGVRGREGAATGTKSLVALDRFLAGRAAMDSFDLALASQRFAEAEAEDESYAHAHFWSARTAAWSGSVEPSEWASSARRAVALSDALAPREREHAAALLDLAEGRMPDACRRYRVLTAADSFDFAAWFGLGDCHARDQVVVRDARSPSGFAFRGSLHTAVAAYRRALSLVPSFHRVERGIAFARLSRRVLYTEELRLRYGILLSPDSQRFAAFPSFSANTLAFVPAPYRHAIGPGSRPATQREAVAWSARTYRQIMAEWVRAFPASADAREGNALALETASGSTGATESLFDALSEARLAVAKSSSTDDRVRRTAMVVRLLLKVDSIAAARALTDSSLATWVAPGASAAGYLAGLAVLTGRATLAASLRARAARDSDHVSFYDRRGRRASLPLDLMSAALQLESYASLGGPRDSVRSTFQRAARLVDSRVRPSDRAEVRQTLLRNSYGLAFDDIHPLLRFKLEPDQDLVLAMRLAIANGDTARVREANSALAALTSEHTPGAVGFDRVHRYATMLLATGDTTAAAHQLESALDAMPQARSMMLKAVPQAAALAPAMALRAELAWRANDQPTFERWAWRAVTLWSGADPEIRQSIDRLRERMRSGPTAGANR